MVCRGYSRTGPADPIPAPLREPPSRHSRNRPQSSMKRNHRVGGISQGGQAGSSRAKASAQTLGAPPSRSAMAARSSSASSQISAAEGLGPESSASSSSFTVRSRSTRSLGNGTGAVTLSRSGPTILTSPPAARTVASASAADVVIVLLPKGPQPSHRHKARRCWVVTHLEP